MSSGNPTSDVGQPTATGARSKLAAPGRRLAPSKHRGAQTELIACAWLLGEGYEVFRNISPAGPVDIIACKGSQLLRIDVKSDSYPARLREDQLQAGVVILYVSADGSCEFSADRQQRYEAITRATLAEITSLSLDEGAALLAARGVRTPGGGQWAPSYIAHMRQRFSVS